jgi:hypothetical protein
MKPSPVYSSTGLRAYSVTRVLSPWAEESFRESGVTEKMLTHAAGKGTLCHDWIQGYAQGLLVKPVPEAYRGYTRSAQLWTDKYVDEVVWVEKELWDNNLGIYGHPDMLAMVKLRSEPILALVDWKTPVQYSKLWKLQLSAYTHLLRLNGFFPEWVGSVQLDVDGDMPRVVKHEYAETDMAYYLQALNVKRYLDS